jgi:RNA polymerase sigma factor FliA
MSAVVEAYRAQQVPNLQELITAHQPLVRRIAYHMLAKLPASVEVDDLLQAGQLGLIEAAQHFRIDAGASFATFAGIRIRGAMLDELRKGDWVPRSVHRRARELADAMRRVEARTGHEAADAEIAEELGIGLNEYHQHVDDAARAPLMSLDGVAESDPSRLDQFAHHDSPERDLLREDFKRALARGIDQLPEREKQVMSLYYQDELNLKEVGAVLGVSESRVCQLHGQALLRLRARLSDWTHLSEAA